MFENLSDKLDRAFKVLKGQGQITEINVAETMKEVRRALLDADVNFKTAKDFSDRVKQKALGQNVLNAVSPGQLLIKIAHDELAQLMGGKIEGLDLSGNPTVILMSGLQGSGKTTFSGKLANHLRKKGKKPLLVAADVYRPAAIDQLETLGKQLEIEVYSERENKDPVKIAQNGIAHAKAKGQNLVIIDTAGRLAIDEQMMDEITRIKKAIQPQETLFVVDKPIKFIGTGEKMEALDEFHPDRMAGRILGMGDVISLVERAQQQFDEKQARALQKKIAKDQFGFDDFLDQIGQIKKMGNMKDLIGMIPGVGKAIKDLDIPDDAFKGIEAIIGSMTPEERREPSIINGSRRQRIALGSGHDVQEVNKLMKQFEETRKMMKIMGDKTKMQNMMRQMQQMQGMKR